MTSAVTVVLKPKELVQDPVLRGLHTCALSTKKVLRWIQLVLDDKQYQKAYDTIRNYLIPVFLHDVIAGLDGIRHQAKERMGMGVDESESLRHKQSQHLLMVCISQMDQLLEYLTIIRDKGKDRKPDEKKIRALYPAYVHQALISITESERAFNFGRAAKLKEHLRILMASKKPKPSSNSAAIATSDGTVKKLPVSGAGDAQLQYYGSTIWGLERRIGHWNDDVGTVAGNLGRKTQEGHVLGSGGAKIASVVQLMRDEHLREDTPARTDPSAGMAQDSVRSLFARPNTPAKRALNPPPAALPPKRRKPPSPAGIPEGEGEELAGSTTSGRQGSQPLQHPPLEKKPNPVEDFYPEEDPYLENTMSPTSTNPALWWREAYETMMGFCAINPDPMGDADALYNMRLLLGDVYVTAILWWEANIEYQRVGLAEIRPLETSDMALQRLRGERDELRPRFNAALTHVREYNSRPLTKSKEELGAEIREIGDKLKVLYPRIASLSTVTGEKAVEDPDENLGFEYFSDAMEAVNTLIDTGELVDIIDKFRERAMTGFILQQGMMAADNSEPLRVRRWAVV